MMTYTASAEHSMLVEVASWTHGCHEDLTISKRGKHGTYCCQFATAFKSMPIVFELTEAEAIIFNRHMTFPASRRDLEDLPRRLQVAKLLALLS